MSATLYAPGQNSVIINIADDSISFIQNRLLFINLLYSGLIVLEASEKVGVTAVTGYHWQERWNCDN